MNKLICFTLAWLFLAAPVTALPVVPGAFGFGMDTRAAYACASNPSVIRVTSLADDGSAGTFRAAVERATVPRVVIFEISGTIVLNSDIAVTAPCLTVAGQTAPSPGITLRGASNATESAGGITILTHDVLIQHLRFRPGDGGPVLPSTAAHDAQSSYGPGFDVHDLVFDHCSFSWASGKNTQEFRHRPPANVTYWRNIISEALFRSKATDPQEFIDNAGQPSSIAMHLASVDQDSVSVVGNLFAHNSDRNPQIGNGARLHFINNVVYDWGKDGPGPSSFPWASFFWVVSLGYPDPMFAAFVSNVYIAGPPPHPSLPLYAVGVWWADVGTKIYIRDTVLDETAESITLFDETRIRNIGFDPRVSTVPEQVSVAGFTILPGSSTKAFVLAHAGARPADRDAVDVRVVNETWTRTGRVIRSQDQVGGWPTLAVNRLALTVPPAPHQRQASGYTALEEWLHGMAAVVEGEVAPKPVTAPPVALTGVQVTP